MNNIKVKITGKNVDNFIKRLNKNKIEMLEIIPVNYKEIYIKIRKQDFEKIDKIKTIYQLEIVEIYGLDHIKYILNKNKYILISIGIGIIILFILSKMIFQVEIVHNKKEIRDLIRNELESEGLSKYHFQKTYDDIQKIKSNILEKYKDQIEWLEIEKNGTKYIVRIEERIITKEKENTSIRNVVAKKDAIILDIDAQSGTVNKNIYDYVKKGDTIISGDIKLYDEVKNRVSAEGKIYGEIWYKVKVEYPFLYYEEKEIGKNKKILNINFLQKNIKLFFNKPTKILEENILLKNNLIPFSISLNVEKEVKIINQEYTLKEAKEKAIELVYEKMKKKLEKDEKILKHIILKEEQNKNSIILEIFVSVKEDITDYQDIIIEENVEN